MRKVLLSRRAAAEFLGTALLLAAVVGSGIMAERLTDDIALALLANTIATGAILTVLILIFIELSGAHFNPAVTLAFVLRDELRPAHALVYVLAQLAGAIAGVLLAHAMFDETLLQLSTKQRSGASLWLSEGVATFGLVLTILACLRWQARTIAAAVGLYITAAYWFTASTSFANPAVTVARSLTDTFSGIAASGVPAFVIVQLIAAAIAVYLVRWLFK